MAEAEPTAAVAVEEVTIRSFAEALEELRTSRPPTEVAWFRGQREDLPLVPSVFREHAAGKGRYWLLPNERNLLAWFTSRAPVLMTNPPPQENRAAWLSLAQHHRLDTRLLDWTKSPLYGLFFAIAAHEARAHRHEHQAELLATDWRNKTLRQHGARARRRRSVGSHAVVWRLFPYELNADAAVVNELQSPVIPTLDHRLVKSRVAAAFEGSVAPDGVPVAVEPVSIHMRHYVQQAAFTLHGAKSPMNTLPRAGRWLKKYVIPARIVPEISKALRDLGVSEATLFPDLDSLGQDVNNTRGYDPV